MPVRSGPLWLGLALWLTGCGNSPPPVFQGYVEGEYVHVAAPLAGRLTTLEVARGRTVDLGAPLFRLEQENEAAAVREAEQRLAKSRAQAANLTKGKRRQELAVIEQQIRQAQAQLQLSRTQDERAARLLAQGSIDQARRDEATTAHARDEARLAELTDQLASARLAARNDEIAAARAEAAATEAVLAQARWRLGQKSLSAPVGGLVTDTLYNPGEWVPAGSPVVELLPPQNIKIRFFIPEAALGRVKPGMAGKFRCDGCARHYDLAVDYIAPNAEYTPPVIYSRENRTKLVYLVEARVDEATARELHPGQPVDVELSLP